MRDAAIGAEWPTRFTLEIFVYLLRFAEAAPSTPAHIRSQLQALADHFSENCGIFDKKLAKLLKEKLIEGGRNG